MDPVNVRYLLGVIKRQWWVMLQAMLIVGAVAGWATTRLPETAVRVVGHAHPQGCGQRERRHHLRQQPRDLLRHPGPSVQERHRGWRQPRSDVDPELTAERDPRHHRARASMPSRAPSTSSPPGSTRPGWWPSRTPSSRRSSPTSRALSRRTCKPAPPSSIPTWPASETQIADLSEQIIIASLQRQGHHCARGPPDGVDPAERLAVHREAGLAHPDRQPADHRRAARAGGRGDVAHRSPAFPSGPASAPWSGWCSASPSPPSGNRSTTSCARPETVAKLSGAPMLVEIPRAGGEARRQDLGVRGARPRPLGRRCARCAPASASSMSASRSIRSPSPARRRATASRSPPPTWLPPSPCRAPAPSWSRATCAARRSTLRFGVSGQSGFSDILLNAHEQDRGLSTQGEVDDFDRLRQHHCRVLPRRDRDAEPAGACPRAPLSRTRPNCSVLGTCVKCSRSSCAIADMVDHRLPAHRRHRRRAAVPPRRRLRARHFAQQVPQERAEARGRAVAERQGQPARRWPSTARAASAVPATATTALRTPPRTARATCPDPRNRRSRSVESAWRQRLESASREIHRDGSPQRGTI